jgi:hypothetical protein
MISNQFGESGITHLDPELLLALLGGLKLRQATCK